MTISLRRRVGDVWVIAEQGDDGQWKVEVVDNHKQPVEGPQRDEALEAALQEISGLRAHIWKIELKREN